MFKRCDVRWKISMFSFLSAFGGREWIISGRERKLPPLKKGDRGGFKFTKGSVLLLFICGIVAFGSVFLHEEARADALRKRAMQNSEVPQVLKGLAPAGPIRRELQSRIGKMAVKTKIAVIGAKDEASVQYRAAIKRLFEKNGALYEYVELPEGKDLTEDSIGDIIEVLNGRDDVNGILLQVPLPKKLRQVQNRILRRINPSKDVDGAHFLSKYEEYAEKILEGLESVDLTGKDIVVIGNREMIPMWLGLVEKDATVTMMHPDNIDRELLDRAELILEQSGASYPAVNVAENKRWLIDVDMKEVLPANKFFKPATPYGAMEFMRFYKILLKGRYMVAVGRNILTGKTAAVLAFEEGANVTIVHSRTTDRPYYTKRAEILLTSIGKAREIKADEVGKGVDVIDFGFNDDGAGGYVGDVDYEAVLDKAAHINPAVGGIGPMTTTMILKNTVDAAEKASLYVNKSISGYLEELGARQPSPGGGSAAASVGAHGAALLKKAVNYTLGNKRYKEVEPMMQELLLKIEKIEKKFKGLIDEDVRAYGAYDNARELPKGTLQEREAREKAMLEASKSALIPPFDVLRAADDALKLCPEILRYGNKYLLSDVQVAVSMLNSAFEGGRIMVKANLDSIGDKDIIFVNGVKALLELQQMIHDDTFSLSKNPVSIFNAIGTASSMVDVEVAKKQHKEAAILAASI